MSGPPTHRGIQRSDSDGASDPSAGGQPPTRCAGHPDRLAVATCPRCGAFSCELCWSTGDSLCVECRERRGESRAIAWELGSLGLFRTTLRIWRRPTEMFERMPDGPVWRALAFAELMWLALLTIVVAGLAATAARPLPRVSSLPIPFFLLAAAVLAVVTVGAIALYVSARALGGSASFSATLRAVAYLHAYAPVYAVVVVALTLVAGPLGAGSLRAPVPHWIAAGIALALGSVGAYAFTHGAHRLSPGRSGLAVGAAVACLAWIAYLLPSAGRDVVESLGIS